jgi:DNA-binding response OmpR family regulator
MKDFQPAESFMLHGHTALILEDEFLIALDLQRVLESLGVKQTLLARNADEARLVSADGNSFRLALIELGLNRDGASTYARHLRDSGVAVVITTADIALQNGVPELPGLPVLVKPLSEAELSAAIEQILAAQNE